jgi:PBP1b-binding outer membrane lipoprotein LpoB
MLQKSLLALLAALLLLSGCSSTQNRGDNQCLTFEDKLQATDLSHLIKNMAAELSAGLPKFDPRSSDDYGVLLVADFVNVNTLKTEQNSLVMSDMLRTYLANLPGKKVIQVEFGKDIRLSDSGVISLTRNTDLTNKQKVGANQVVVGTYLDLQNKLIINLRAIDPSNQIISSAVVRELKYSCNGGKLNLLNQ